MSEAPDLAAITAAVAAAGFLVRGGFACDGERIPGPGGRPARALVLVGSVGAVGFEVFRRSPFRNDGLPDPLDRFTQHVMGPVASALGAAALYPHHGPPWLPFQRWAARAEGVQPSPLGLVIHPRHGLWHAYRAALAFPHPVPGLQSVGPCAAPCESCVRRPCLDACPVSAYGPRGFDAGACRAHLSTPAGRTCLEHGCQARAACPVAPHLRYRGEQCRFHMAAFARSAGVTVLDRPGTGSGGESCA